MNFNDIYKKIKEISENQQILECPSDQSQSTPTADTVSMNVSMNAHGPTGIRELINVLQGIEAGEEELTGQELISAPGELGDFDDNEADSDIDIIDDSYSNSADRTCTMGVDSVTATGDDLHSKGGPEPRKPAGGGNPYRTVDEGLLSNLRNLYKEIKLR